MLNFLRRYQRFFFLVITAVMITSFAFFGAYDAYTKQPEVSDRLVGKTIGGKKMMLSDVRKLSRFIATDCEDSIQSSFPHANLCNDGVVRSDILKSGIGSMLANEYFDVLKDDLIVKLERAKRYHPYVHSELPILSAKLIWDLLVPNLSKELTSLQETKEVSPSFFSQLAMLYQYQGKIPADRLKSILLNQEKQCSWVKRDSRLASEDLSLFGFHSVNDWFGPSFLDIVSQFILNAATEAESKGYRVSLDEAKGDLLFNFKKAKEKHKLEISFSEHLRSIGLDEREASSVWQKVLLFRKYFHDVGETVFVDRLPLKDFAKFAQEQVKLQAYSWQVPLKTASDLAEFQLYVNAIAPLSKRALPNNLYSIAEIEKKMPELVQATYKAEVAEVSKKEVGLKASLKDVIKWEVADVNWKQLKDTFKLLDVKGEDERMRVLLSLEPSIRAKVDKVARDALVDVHPEWIEEALKNAPKNERRWSVSGSDEITLKEEGKYFLIDSLEKIEDKHVLTFQEAKPYLSKKVGKVEGEYIKERNPFHRAVKEAYSALKKNSTDAEWVQSGDNVILDQFKLSVKDQNIARSAKESWMKNEAFLMLPGTWSPIQQADNDQIVFFYLHEKKIPDVPILDQLSSAKAMLSADAKGYLAEQLLQKIKEKNTIVIPLQKEGE